MIKADSSDEALTSACFPRPSDVTNEALAGERGKRRVVCAVLSKAHYDLGVVFGSEIEASFGVGVEWDRAKGRILNYLRVLSFVKAHADKDGFLLVEYRHAQGSPGGRVYSGGIGYQACTKETRAFCSARFYVEDDIVNAFPSKSSINLASGHLF
jgi:hypothetical protein